MVDTTAEAIATRKSTRSDRPAALSEEESVGILRAASAAPVAMVRYDSLHLTVLQDRGLLSKRFSETAEMISKLLGEERNMDFRGSIPYRSIGYQEDRLYCMSCPFGTFRNTGDFYRITEE